MTEEAKPQSNEKELTKLMIDRPSNFRFHTAYLAYSEIWHRSTSEEKKTELNEIMSSLHKEETNYSSFAKGWSDMEHGVPDTMPIQKR